ncbi:MULTISPECIES: hypothetical protein [Streptomyces]|uniref:Lipoprotein n=1 Tax=Streptomyces katrae TaxID=68223 RepID=A0ABT7GXI4_9ACTN|nr:MULTISPECIES: hypothetical protein [Streptomyces]MDK9498338.1 hypothetical protein [Streptomyces katrae]GLX20035.1 hypothetical protein Slala01_36790 [Streptomyces lavendulae subsp. lavendulae]GLX27530.1 hypothetical protein Slala02_33500 [Streptomyces lavendulae subsp. lavendulae]
MGSGPAPRGATAARGTTALLAAALTAATLTTTLLSGCAGPTRAPHTAPAPRTTPPQALCAALVTHWAVVVLDAGEGEDAVGLDYQSMGLSGDQNEILRAVLEAARAEQRAGGAAAARESAARDAEARCAERHRSGTPTGGPWQ